MSDNHVWVAFYVTDWLAGTRHLPRIHRSVYHDVCCKIWETGSPVSARDAKFMVADLPDGASILDDLVETGKLDRLGDGSLTNKRAVLEAKKARGKVDQWRAAGRASARARAERRSEGKSNDVETALERGFNELESELEKKGSVANATGAAAPDLGLNGGSAALPNPDEYPDKVDWLFHPAVIGFMCSGGANEKNVRAFIGKLRAVLGPPLAVKRILEARDGKVSDPISYLQSRLPKRREATGVHRRHFDDVDYGESGKL